jgi:hypothetical protein
MDSDANGRPLEAKIEDEDDDEDDKEKSIQA